MVAGLQRREGYKAAPPNLPKGEAYKESADSISSLIFIVGIADNNYNHKFSLTFSLEKGNGAEFIYSKGG
jgi:hypothetical protein